VSDFFEPPPQTPPPQRPPRYRRPAWAGPPEGTLPGVLALECMLARSERAVVWVSHLGVYPTGFGFEVVVHTSEDDDELDPFEFGHVRRRARAELPAGLLRLGVQFPDGSKATNTGGWGTAPGAPPSPVMRSGNGGGGGRHWQQEQWVWPLPPADAAEPTLLVCEWPAAGISLTTHELDVRAIHAAAARAEVVFSDAQLPEPPAGDVSEIW